MKTLVLSLAIKDDSLYSEIIEMLAKQLKEKGITIFQQAGPGVTILNGAQTLADKQEDEKEEEEVETPEEPESDDESGEVTTDEVEADVPEEPEPVEGDESEPEEMPELNITSEDEEIAPKEYINGVRSFYLSNDELVAEKGVTESMLFVDEIVIDGPYALFKFNNTFYRYPIYESNSEGTFIKLDFYTSEMTFKEVKCLLKTNEGQNFDLILGADHEK